MSPSNSSIEESAGCRLSLEPELRLSRTRTFQPPCSRRSTTWLPMNPAPPVTSAKRSIRNPPAAFGVRPQIQERKRKESRRASQLQCGLRCRRAIQADDSEGLRLSSVDVFVAGDVVFVE